MVVFAGIGFFIGWLIDKSSPWPVILAVVGLLIGLFSFISYLLYLLKSSEEEKKKETNKDIIEDDKKE